MFNLTALLIAHCLLIFKFKYVNSLTIFALLSPLIFLTFGTNWRSCIFNRWNGALCALNMLLGTLTSNQADGNENVKKAIGLISKTTTSHVHHTFLHISIPFLHDYDVKMPNFAFYGGRKQATTTFYFSFWAWLWSLEIQVQEGSPPTFDRVSG